MVEKAERPEFTIITSKGCPYMKTENLRCKRLLKIESNFENNLNAILSNQIPKDRRKERFQIRERL